MGAQESNFGLWKIALVSIRVRGGGIVVAVNQ